MRAADCKSLSKTPEGVFRQSELPEHQVPAAYLWFQIVFIKNGRSKECFQRNPKALTEFVNNTELYRRICAFHDIGNRRLRKSCFDIELIL